MRAGGSGLFEGMVRVPHETLNGSGLFGDNLARPDLALGFSLPLWLQLAGLVWVNVLAVQAISSALRANADKSEPLDVVMVQVGSWVPGGNFGMQGVERLWSRP